MRFTPVLCAAIGAALGFYCVGSFVPAAVLGVLFAAVAALCVFRVLASLAATARLQSPQPKPPRLQLLQMPPQQLQRLQLMPVYSTVFAVGLCVGICASVAARNDVRFGLPEEKITALNGVLLEDPRLIAGGRAMAAMSLRETAGSGGVRVKSRGELTVFFPEEGALKIREFGRGATVFTEGRLRQSQGAWTFSAQSIHVVKQASKIERMRTGIRLNLIQRFDGYSWGGLALALLVGIKDSLDTNLTSIYRSAGLSYILALSGMHLAVIASLVAFLLRKPLGLKAAAIVGAVIIVLYCFIVGPMPSLNRAALMYLLGVLAVLGALPKESMSVLALSFLIQIVISPASGNSLSFILSYLAMIGILIVSKALISLFSGKAPDFLLQPLSISCGAFLATAGVTCFAFGELAPSGIIAGLIIVPATTAFMIGAMLWLVLDLVSASFILNWPMFLLYQTMEKTAFFAGKAPGISASKPFLVLAFSVILSFLIVVLDRKRREALLRLKPFS